MVVKLRRHLHRLEAEGEVIWQQYAEQYQAWEAEEEAYYKQNPFSY